MQSQQPMYNLIRAHYDNDDISQRKQQYYNQVLKQGRRLSPHRVIKIQKIPKPNEKIVNNDKYIINNGQSMMINNSNIQQNSFQYNSRITNNQFDNKLLSSDINRMSSSQLGRITNDNNNTIGIHNNIAINNTNVINNKSQQKHNQFNIGLNQSNVNKQRVNEYNVNRQRVRQSQVNKQLKNRDPQRYRVLEQRAQLYKKLQLVTLGLPVQQNTIQQQLISPNYILPHYKSQSVKQLKQQQTIIKQLTVKMIQNEKIINKISYTKFQLINRVNRIKQIDNELYNKLDQDKCKEIQNNLNIAKNLLAQGQSQDKIIHVLKQILY